MDKSRWFVTYCIAELGVIVSWNDSLWWMFSKIFLFSAAAVVIEEYRSARQNEENLEE